MKLRENLVTSRLKRFLISICITSVVMVILLSIVSVRVHSNWFAAKTSYDAWTNGSQKQNCEQLFKDSTQQFKDLKCESSGGEYERFHCKNPHDESLRNQINFELRSSGCPFDKIIEQMDGVPLLTLDSPSNPESYFSYLMKYNDLRLSEVLKDFAALFSILFLLLSLTKALILETHAGWFRLTILLSGLAAVTLPIIHYNSYYSQTLYSPPIENLVTGFFFALMGTASLIVYGRRTWHWIYSGFKSQPLNRVNQDKVKSDQPSQAASRVIPETHVEPIYLKNGLSGELAQQFYSTSTMAVINDPKICIHCSCSNPVDSLFCSKCGSSLEPSKEAQVTMADIEAEKSITPKKNPILNLFMPSFIGKHWRGDYSLPISYWVVSIIVFVLYALLADVSHYFFESFNLGLRVTGALMLGMIFSAWAAVIWLIVGVWRSADKHVQRGGIAFWAGLVKIIIALNLIGTMSLFMNQIPIVTEGAKMLAGIDSIPPYKIAVIRDGAELELSGGMPNGTAEAVAMALSDAPKVKIIHLNSIGGRINEANKLYSIIKSQGLITYTSSECASACTIAFLAGREKYLSENGKLGFHSTSIGGQDGIVVQEMNQGMREKLRENGIPDSFINHVLATSARDIWIPSHQELIDAKVIDAVVDPKYFGTSGVSQSVDAFKIEKSLLEIPFYAALSKYDKKSFARLRNIMVMGLQNGKSLLDIQASVSTAMLSEVLPQYLKTAPDVELMGFWSSQVEQMKLLSKINEQLCADFNYPEFERSQVDFQKYMPTEIKNRYFVAMAEMVKAAVETPQISQSNPTVQTDLAMVAGHLMNKYPEASELVKNPVKFKNRPSALCNVPMELYSQILAMPPKRAGALLRFMNT